MRRILVGIPLFVFLLLFQVLPAHAQTVTYFYDELGRLVGAVDPNGESATYRYDSVGNILSISRGGAAQVTLIEFTPNNGPAATQVTIYGTSFSSTPSQNTVTFNGVAATVTSSTTTKIVTSVPASATTGSIVVTAPGGAATSASAFTVGPSAAPTVTSFTPTIGTAATAVTITGTNFETMPSSDRVLFNISPGTVTSASATSLGVTVPPTGTSGRISVETPAGKAISSADFFLPPSPFGTADVTFTGRMTIGSSSTLSIPTAAKIGLMIFDGTEGQRFSLQATNTSIGSSGVHVYRPNAASLFVGPFTFAPNGFIDATSFPQSGTYTILIDPLFSNTGNMTLTLYNVPPDLTATIMPTLVGGADQPVTISISVPGQNARLTFAGTAGGRVSLKGTSSTITVNGVSIARPEGTSLVSPTSFIPNGFIDAVVLPATGIYTILEDPLNANIGGITFTLYDVPPDVTGSITAGGAPVTLSMTTPGQNGRLTFSGTSGNRISLRGTGGTVIINNISITSPDGTTLVSPTSFTPNGFIDTKSLSATGTYTILADPFSSHSGGTTLTLYDVPPDVVTGTIISYPPVSVTLNTPGQNGQVNFSVSALRVGQLATVHVTNNSMSTVTVKLLSPSGVVLKSTTSSVTNFDLAPQILATTGTYSITIDPVSFNTGQMNVDITAESQGGE